MNSRFAMIALFSVASAAAPAFGQFGFANFALRWSEVNAATHNPVPNSNGILDLGEAARISISVEFSPIGTTFGSGALVVAGFAGTGFGLGASIVGAWSDLQIPAGFLAEPLTELPFGSVWQPHPPPGISPIATNPIPTLWSAVWMPPTYQPRTAAFGLNTLWDNTPRLFMRNGTDPQGNPTYSESDCEWDWGSNIGVPIVPAPPTAAMLGLAVAVAARRRRPTHISPP